MRTLKRTLPFLLVSVAIFTAISLFFARELTKPPRRMVGDPPPELARMVQSVTFHSRDNLRLSGWFAPCENSVMAVVLLHGNGTSRRQVVARVQLFHDAGYAVLLYDARGHGLSEGDKVSAGWFETEDLMGALDFLNTKGLKEFGCLGISQGGATILLAAEKLPESVRWAIVESSYPNIRDALDRRFRSSVHLPGWFAGSLLIPFAELRLGLSIDKISPIDHIAFLRCPVFVLGGSNDPHTLPESTRAIFGKAREPKELWIVEGAAHVDLCGFTQQEYNKRILAFIQRYR